MSNKQRNGITLQTDLPHNSFFSESFMMLSSELGKMGEARGPEFMLLPTSLVGSYAQPEWLIDRKKLAGRFPPRVRVKELWRVAPEFLEQAQDDATLIAIH